MAKHMSMNAKFRCVTPEELTNFQQDPESLSVFFGLDRFDQLDVIEMADEGDFDEDAFLDAPTPAEDPERFLDITNDWQAIHFLLTGEIAFASQSRIPPPLCNVVMGGTTLGNLDVGYGPPRFLTPAEVQEVSRALEETDAAVLGSRFDVEAYNRAGGYPFLRPSGWKQEDVEPLLETHSALAAFYREAAQAGDALLLWSD